MQIKFLSKIVEAEYNAQDNTKAASKVKTEVSDSVKHGRAHMTSDAFEDLATHILSREGFTGKMTVLAFRNTGAERVTQMRLASCAVRCFVDANHLACLVETDMLHGEFRMYIPRSPNNPLVDAWCICTINEKRVVAGLQMTVAKLKHPIAGEGAAKEQFNAIHGALAKHRVEVHKAAWVVFVLLPAHYSKFPYQYAKAGPGQQQRPAGRIWPHAQAKLALQLDAAAPAPSPAQAAMRPKREAVADGAGGGYSPYHGHTKRARRGKL